MAIYKQSITDQVFNHLREEIVNLELKQGEQINPKKISEENGISVMPVRDALGRLASYGLVEIKPRVGYFVRSFSKKDILEIMEVRKLNELYCLRTHFSAIDLFKVRKFTEIMKVGGEALSRNAFDQMDDFLHDLVIQASGNSYLIENYNHVKDLVVLLRHLDRERIVQAHTEHQAIVESILAGDCQGAVSNLEYHLERVTTGITHYLEEINVL